MISKWPVQCSHCDKFIGFQTSAHPLPGIYCYACEDAVTHKLEMQEQEMERYRALARS